MAVALLVKYEQRQQHRRINGTSTASSNREIPVDFQIKRDVISESSVTLTIFAAYTDEEAEALEQAGAWEKPCIDNIYAILEIWRWENPEITIKSPTFYDLVDPGIMMEDFSPYQADRFESNFQRKYGRRIQNALGPMLQQFRRREHVDRIAERDAYFGKGQKQLPRR